MGKVINPLIDKYGILALYVNVIRQFCENAHNPYHDRRQAIQAWKKIATLDVDESPAILDNTKPLLENGIRTKDALHVACAIEGKADCFLTTDDRLLKKLQANHFISALNPMDYIKELRHDRHH